MTDHDLHQMVPMLRRIAGNVRARFPRWPAFLDEDDLINEALMEIWRDQAETWWFRVGKLQMIRTVHHAIRPIRRDTVHVEPLEAAMTVPDQSTVSVLDRIETKQQIAHVLRLPLSPLQRRVCQAFLREEEACLRGDQRYQGIEGVRTKLGLPRVSRPSCPHCGKSLSKGHRGQGYATACKQCRNKQGQWEYKLLDRSHPRALRRRAS